MANGDEFRFQQERINALKEELGIKSKLTEQEKTALSLSRKSAAQALDLIGKQASGLRSIKEIEGDISKAQALQAQLKEQVKNTEGETQRILSDSKEIQDEIVAKAQEELIRRKGIENSLGLSGKALGFINNLLGSNSSLTNEILANTRKRLDEQDKLDDKLTGFNFLLQETGKAIVDNISDPLTIVALLLENSTAVNKFAKDLGVSDRNALGLRNNMSQVAASTGDVFITSKKVSESFFTMSEALGFVADFSGQTLVTMTNLEKRIGLTANEAANMTALFRLQGNNTEEIADNTFATLANSIKLGNVAVTPKQVFEEIAQTTDSIVVSLGASPIAIGKAIVAAKQLGATLQDIDQIAASTLNFEQSISSELEAELLTGKQLNLERARLLALNNDLEGVAKEITKQGIDFASFSEMNRIQQESIASSLGLSRDELSKITLQQQLQTMSSEEIKNNFGEGAYQQALALSASEKFEAVLSKIKGLGSDLLVILTPFIDLLALIATPIAAVVGGIGSLVSGITSTFVSTPMAMGGIVPARAGGTLTTIGEAGQAEAIIPLSRAGEFGLGGTEINYDKMAMAMSKAQVNVTTKYNSFRAYSTTSNGGRYQSSARYESKFV